MYCYNYILQDMFLITSILTFQVLHGSNSEITVYKCSGTSEATEVGLKSIGSVNIMIWCTTVLTGSCEPEKLVGQYEDALSIPVQIMQDVRYFDC